MKCKLEGNLLYVLPDDYEQPNVGEENDYCYITLTIEDMKAVQVVEDREEFRKKLEKREVKNEKEKQ